MRRVGGIIGQAVKTRYNGGEEGRDYSNLQLVIVAVGTACCRDRVCI